MRARILCLFVLLGACSSHPAGVATGGIHDGAMPTSAADLGMPPVAIGIAPGLAVERETDYAAVALRGYGSLAGRFYTLSGGTGALSVLAIDGVDAAHASVTLAKLLSDLTSLGGVTPADLGGGVQGYTIADQGSLVAFTIGASVIVVSGESATDVVKEQAAIDGMRSDAAAAVPMYLDRWDRYGFNFYYAPFHSTDATFDYRTDFDYAKAHGGTGFALWSSVLEVTSAEGQLSSSAGSWVIESAQQRGLPVVLNDTIPFTGPSWLLSQFRGTGQLLDRVPSYAGSECGSRNLGFGECVRVWGNGAFEDAALGVVQKTVRDYGEEPNVVSILEPHGELENFGWDLFTNSGPAADASLQSDLQTRYASVQALDVAWNGGSSTLTSWADVHAPAPASFAGHDATAFDITGPWRVLSGTYATAGSGAPAWTATAFDDSAWGLVAADDHRMLLPAGATALRTHFTAPSSGATYLYVWPLGASCGDGNFTRAFLNGTELTAKIVGPPPDDAVTPHWSAFVVSGLGSGLATLALSIPPCTGGYTFGYATYLSSTAPARFPNLASRDNTRWIDFTDWLASMRGRSVANGMSMIRQIDRDKPIEAMAPNKYADVVKVDAEEYGASFHDTGFMGGFWIDELPGHMRSLGLPFVVEPGSPATTIAGLKALLSLWITEGTNGISYFQNIGDITWNTTLEPEYEALRPMLAAIGKYHGAHTDVAQLFSRRTARLLGVPWHGDPDTDLNGGAAFAWSLAEPLEHAYDLDDLFEADFARRNADQYKVIIDGNSTFMDAQTVSDIEKWVTAGGTFVTYVQTGRHSPTGANTWPISTLTGYSVTSVDPALYRAPSPVSNKLSEAPGQTLLHTGWNGTLAHGLHMKRVAAEAEDVLLWPDGSVAVGERAVGKGRVVALGATFANDVGWSGAPQDTSRMMTELIQSANATPVPGSVVAESGVAFTGGNHFRHFVSNNGLYDVWVVSWDGTTPVDVDLTIATDVSTAIDVLAGAPVALTKTSSGSQLKAIHLTQWDTRMYLTARKQIATAPLDWFTLQRTWWRGTTAPRTAPYPAPPHRYTIDVGTKYPMSESSASGWSQSFDVPATWTGGTKQLWVADARDPVFLGAGSALLDGTSVASGTNGVYGVDVTAQLQPGTTHTFEAQNQAGADTISGVRGEAWLRFIPDPLDTLDLSGAWTPSIDGYTFAGSMTLPGAWATGATGSTQAVVGAERTITVPASWSGSAVVLAVESELGLSDVIVNGRWIPGGFGYASTHGVTLINLTGYVVAGATNTIGVASFNESPVLCDTAACVGSIELRRYAKGSVYP